jgi:hypothetical protein
MTYSFFLLFLIKRQVRVDSDDNNEGDTVVFPDLSFLISAPAMLDPSRKDPVPEVRQHLCHIDSIKYPIFQVFCENMDK